MGKKGFTLIETIISLAVFGIVVSVAANAFISGLKIQRKSLALQAAQNELRGVLEFMSREIRMSHIDWPTTGGQNPLLVITTHPDNKAVSYSLAASATMIIARNSFPLTFDEVTIKNLQFQVSNADNPPALVTIIVNAETVGAYAGQEINLQTTVSTRDY